MAKDPYPQFRNWLIENSFASEGDLAGIEAGIAVELEEALQFTLASAFPDAAEIYRDVYHDEVPA